MRKIKYPPTFIKTHSFVLPMSIPKQDKAGHTEALKKTLHMLQIFLISQLGCGSRDFQKNAMKKTAKGNHWG